MKKTIFRLLEYVGKYKGLMLLSVLSALISVVCTLYAPLIIGRAIDGMVAKEYPAAPACCSFWRAFICAAICSSGCSITSRTGFPILR